jgi:bla regulator protein BlaR1
LCRPRSRATRCCGCGARRGHAATHLYSSGARFDCGALHHTDDGQQRGGRLHDASLASLLRSTAGRYVVDKTGLTGNYRVKLEGVRLFEGPGLDPTAGPDDAPSIFTALQEQLGLKLESSRARVEVLVIDYIEPPSEN